VIHELEAQKDEVQVKKAEVKKLNDRVETLMHEKEELVQGKLTSDRKLVSFKFYYLVFNLWIYT